MNTFDDLTEMNVKSGKYGVVWEDLLSIDEIEQIHLLSKKYEKTRGVILDNTNSQKRKSDTIWIPYDNNSKWLYEKITNRVRKINNDIFQFELSGGQPFQYTIYESEELGEYDWHNDVMDCGDNNVRKLSVVILLSEKTEFSGGSFLVSPDGGKPKEILMKPGRMVLFPSWTPHCVTPVLEGTRISLVMWLYGKRFK